MTNRMLSPSQRDVCPRELELRPQSDGVMPGSIAMREEIKEYKRSRIIEEASRLFYEQGFEATSVEMLASELGVTKPFIYSYFPNKRSILEAVYEQSASRLVGHIQQALKSDGSPEERLSPFIPVFVNETIKHQIAVGI